MKSIPAAHDVASIGQLLIVATGAIGSLLALGLIALALSRTAFDPQDPTQDVVAVATKRLESGPWPDAASAPEAPVHR